MRYIKGNALAQYAIIIALVALALIPVFLVFGKTIVDQFDYFYKCLSGSGEATQQTVQPVNQSGNQSNVVETPAPVVEEGSLGGTPSQPVKKCSDGNCTIDFGDYVLSGIPDNFQEYVESAGTSGGTDTLSSLLIQIAEQLKEQGDDAGYQQYKDLANLGHFIGDIQSEVENYVNTCGDLTSGTSPCYYNLPELASLDNVPDNVSHLLTNYSNDNIQLIGGKNNNISSARYFEVDDPAAFCPNEVPSHAFVKKFDEIMSNPNYSTELKAITEQLYREIATLSENQSIPFFGALTQNREDRGALPVGSSQIDPITGELGPVVWIEPFDGSIQKIQVPDVSNITDLDSTLICTAGNNDGDGNACH